MHDAGGQVYVDGANLNALVGLAKPGHFGGDVSHLNLHKTFCIPHGGGGPGVGPVGVRAHLAPYLPNHPLQPAAGPGDRRRPDLGRAVGLGGHPADLVGVRPADGRRGAQARHAGGRARRQLRRQAAGAALPGALHRPGGLVAHECIIDLRPITKATGVTVDDVAKRLIDYGFHAPTMSFPVAGTLMIEPTESEDLAELDRFCDAMIAIRARDREGRLGRVARGRQPAARTPRTPRRRSAASGSTPTRREEAVFPAGVSAADKYWPPVRRIDGRSATATWSAPARRWRRTRTDAQAHA